VPYVASTGDNKVFAIDHARTSSKDAGIRRAVYTDNVHLHGPLALSSNGHLIKANRDAVNAVARGTSWSNSPPVNSSSRSFRLILVLSAEHSGLQSAATLTNEIRFAAVDDNQNTLRLWTINGG
jgi:hypothetical protein